MKILVMNGPNINFLGIREKGIYGEQNYEALVSMIEKKAEELGVDVAAIPKIEVHISNVHTREEFRHTSVTVPVCNGQVVGLGLKGYLYAMEAVVDLAMKK